MLSYSQIVFSYIEKKKATTKKLLILEFACSTMIFTDCASKPLIAGVIGKKIVVLRLECSTGNQEATGLTLQSGNILLSRLIINYF